MNDNFINQFDKPKPPRRAFATDLYKRINEPMKGPAHTPLFRVLAATLAVITLLAAMLFVSPSARAFADGVIHQFGFFNFVQGETQAQPTKQVIENNDANSENVDPAMAQAKMAEVNKGIEPDAAAASQVAGFPVLAPTYLPEGYTPLKDWKVEKKGDLIQSVDVSYKYGENELLNISQLHSSLDIPPQVYTMPEIKDVTVHGQPGVWLPEGDGVWLPKGKHTLVWGENGVTITISSNVLSLEEMLKIAEAMK